MISEGYGDVRTIERRVRNMENWLASPILMTADADAEYKAVLEIDLNDINEPIVCCPNDPDDAKFLSEVAGDKVDEVFIGSCMTNIGHFRATGKLLEHNTKPLKTRFWLCPPTKMDEHTLMEEGYYNIYGRNGVRTEMPGCSLCMGNQARVGAGTTVLSTSTRNFPNRLGDGANVYLTSAEVAAVGGILGRLPTVEEYMEYAMKIDSMSDEIFRYMSFDQIASFQSGAEKGKLIAAVQIEDVKM
jgi:aconitate hydratase 2/2-methylisocitrate dehydratase